MQIRVGYELIYNCPQPTPMMLMLNIHYTRASDIVIPDHLTTTPSTPITAYRDIFGNWCNRIVAPKGQIRLARTAVVKDSRYCETDLLSQIAWNLFGHSPPGWARVQAICDFVHNHIAFGYEYSRSTKSAFEAFNEGKGVCRDYTHLAIAFCRCMNIPARYCTGYLGEIGVLPPYGPMDFAAWIEAYLGGRWCIFDPRNNVPRIGRVLIARGRDAADVAISNTFGPNTLLSFKVWTDEISGVGTP